MGNKKIIGLYSPYLPDHRGGGERYLLSCASLLSQKANIELLMSDADRFEAKKYEQLFGLDLSHVTAVEFPTKVLDRVRLTSRYDAMLAMTDGSLFFSAAKRNVLHLQFPFTDLKPSLLDRLKLFNWSIRNANSSFTQRVVQRHWKIKIQYLHEPAVDSSRFIPREKESIMLSIGRFYDPGLSGAHAKRQDIILDVFKSLVDRGLTGWRLVLLGTTDPDLSSELMIQKLEQSAKGYPVKILPNKDLDTVSRYLGISRLYIHAAGFGVDEELHPAQVEHFGITIIEAMAAGAIPVVIPKGGPAGTVQDRKNGLWWSSPDEAVEKIEQLLVDPTLESRLRSRCIADAQQYSEERFASILYEMMGVS